MTSLEMASLSACPVEVVLRAEFGIALPRPAERLRLATAYHLSLDDYVRLALDEAERAAG